MEPFNISELIIEISGVPDAHMPIIEGDLRLWVSGIAGAAENLGLPYRLKRVTVTADFDGAVNRVLKNNYGFDGYAAKRNEIQAIGKTLPIRIEDGAIEFEVILDVNQLSQWGDPSSQQRNAIILQNTMHELFHVALEGQHLKRLGNEEYMSSEDTKEQWFSSWAKILLDEYRVDCLVDGLLAKISADEAGNPGSLRVMTESEEGGWVDHAIFLLSEIESVVDRDIPAFKSEQVTFEEVIVPIPHRIQDLLVFIIHTVATYEESDDWEDLRARIKGTTTYQRFLDPNMSDILRIISSIRFGDTGDTIDAAIAKIAANLEIIHHKFGLSYRTVADGVFIGVD